MADYERNVLSHYNIQSAFPDTWPTELDESEDEQPDEIGVRRSRSRYSALERSASDRRSALAGAQKLSDGRSNLVQKDEPDPLGAGASVLTSLRSRGLPVEQDPRLRNKFLLSSTQFSPALFLSQTHHDATTDDLINGLQFLSKSIDQKSASLKVLVETNFERFVRAKATIDNVYTEMRNQGADPNADRPSTPRHSRNISRQSGIHYRNFSGGSAAGMVPTPTPVSKNALRKETEYGVQGIRGPLLEVSQKAEDVWGPALSGKEREGSLKSIAQAVDKDRALYELGSNLRLAINQKDYEKAVQQYNSARSYSNQAKSLGERAMQSGQTLSDDQVHKILVTGRMWADVEEQVKGLKRDIWRHLSSTQSVLPLPGASQAEEHMELIGILLELGVDDNPIWVWLLSRWDYLKSKISAVVERSRIEIEILRRRLGSAERPSPDTTAFYIRQASKDNPDTFDTDQIVEFWNTITTYLTKLLSMSSGLLGEVVDFWDSAKSFIEGSKQKSLPTGFEGESRKHHRLSDAGVRDLTKGAIELSNMLREAVHSLFADAPAEDISSLFSPAPNSGTPSTPITGVAFSPTEGRLGRIDPENLPAPSPKRGEAWEDFAFWPPNSNSLSAVHYLGKILALLSTAAGEIAAISPVAQNSQAYEKVKGTLATARERCLRAVCEAWGKDAESCKSLEDWMRSPERGDQTKLPLYFEAFEKKILVGVQQVMYLSEGGSKPGAKDVITPPPSKLLQMVRTQFVNSIYKAVSGMMENAESTVCDTEDEWVLVTAIDAKANDDAVSSEPIHISNRNARLLLTLSNLKALRHEHVPQLVQLFESSFSVKLTDESKTIRDGFGQIDSKLFHSYTQPTIDKLIRTIKEGIGASDWAPSSGRPDQVRPYVYTSMMILVLVHTEVSTTVPTTSGSSSLLNEVLSYCLEKVSQALLDGFKERKPNMYTLPALMQATLDTEFIAQTMSQYSTTKAGEIQGQIYMELDKRSANDARARLQQELGEMRVVLKKLREQSRNSFGCFKRSRSEKDRGRPERKPTGT
jgi:exocyst complex component 2